MTAAANPSEIAREAIRQLAVRRLQPTPDNYRLLYEEIGGAPATRDSPSVEREIVPFLRDQIAKILADAVVPRLGYHESLAAEARALASAFREARTLQALQEQARQLAQLAASFQLGDNHAPGLSAPAQHRLPG